MHVSEHDASGGTGGRLYGLDIFRIALVLLVWLFHSRMHIGCDYGPLNAFIGVGALAMSGFFMLSGFAMWNVYSQADFSSWSTIRKFYLKRIISLWPLMIVAGYLFVLPDIVGGVWPGWKALLLLPIELLGLSSTFDSLFHVSHTGGTWFVSCIFICYLAFPLLMTVARQLNARARVVWMALLVLMMVLCPIIVKVFAVSSVYGNPFFRFYEFNIGLLLASLLPYVRGWLVRCRLANLMVVIAITLVHILVISMMVRHLTRVDSTDYVICSVASLPFHAALLCVTAISKCPGFMRCGAVVAMSASSFAFFMAQFFCFGIARALGCCGNVAKIGVSFFVCSALAAVLHWFVQKPTKKYLYRKLGLYD